MSAPSVITGGEVDARPRCQCGCGKPVARRYAPGHDARHKSALKQALTSGDWRQAWQAADLLDELGWAHFADPADLRDQPYRTSRGRPLLHVASVARFQVDHLGGCHADRRCRTLTERARSQGGLNRITRLASDAYVTFLDSTPELVARLPHSWDQCTECTTDRTRDEDAEHQRVTQLAIDPEFEGRQTKKNPPTEWELEQEDGTSIRVTRAPDGVLTLHRPPQPTWAAPNPTTRVA